MNRTMTIAAATALCLHAVFLLGFNSAAPQEHVRPQTDLSVKMPPEEVEITPPPRKKVHVSHAVAQRPTLAEHPAAVSTAPFVFKTPPLPAIRPIATDLNALPIRTISLSDWPADTSKRTLFDASQLDGKPRTRVRIAPVYPPEMRNQGLSGQVIVVFQVDRDGRVAHARAVRSTNSGFNEAAVRAVRQWRFVPGRHNGRRVAFRMQVAIGFRLND